MVALLAGYRVVDFGTAMVGPLATRLLADLGAEVIKVESRARLDGYRLGRPMIGDDVVGGDQGLWPELQPTFHTVNRDKMGITVNLKTARGLELVKRLIAQSDVVANNYSPGVLGRLGLDYAALKAVKPDIILVSMPGTGETGPLRDYLTFAPTVAALCGLASMVGYEDGPLTGQVHGAWCDVVNAVSAALATVAALYHRSQTGEGQYIESAQLEASVAFMAVPIMDYVMNGRIAGLQGNSHPVMAPHNHYPVQGEDRWVAIAVQTQVEWTAFCRAAGHEEWTADPRFEDASARLKHRGELDRLVSEWTRQLSAQEVVERLQAAGVAATLVMSVEDQFTDGYFSERRAFVEVEHPKVGLMWLPGLACLFPESPDGARSHAPLLGQHNTHVFGDLLGLSPQEVDGLVREEVLG